LFPFKLLRQIELAMKQIGQTYRADRHWACQGSGVSGNMLVEVRRPGSGGADQFGS